MQGNDDLNKNTAGIPQDDGGDPLRKWLSKKEAMKFFDVGKSTFNALRTEHGLPCFELGHIFKVYIDDLIAFMMRHRKVRKRVPRPKATKGRKKK